MVTVALLVTMVILLSVVLLIIPTYLDQGEPLLVIKGGVVNMLPATCGSNIYLRFNNSLTGSQVMIMFEYCGSIEGRYMSTDSAAYEYYSMGLIDVNRSISSYEGKYMAFCSENGAYIGVKYLEIPLQPGSCMVVVSVREVFKNILGGVPDISWIRFYLITPASL